MTDVYWYSLPLLALNVVLRLRSPNTANYTAVYYGNQLFTARPGRSRDVSWVQMIATVTAISLPEYQTESSKRFLSKKSSARKTTTKKAHDHTTDEGKWLPGDWNETHNDADAGLLVLEPYSHIIGRPQLPEE
ncbi:hypothetical protein J6590_015121 [Homalodisca vitripennis]|nr:hypothetical protein J6590_015121 [Homalodisca vitripennis]